MVSWRMILRCCWRNSRYGSIRTPVDLCSAVMAEHFEWLPYIVPCDRQLCCNPDATAHNPPGGLRKISLEVLQQTALDPDDQIYFAAEDRIVGWVWALWRKETVLDALRRLSEVDDIRYVVASKELRGLVISVTIYTFPLGKALDYAEELWAGQQAYETGLAQEEQARRATQVQEERDKIRATISRAA